MVALSDSQGHGVTQTEGCTGVREAGLSHQPWPWKRSFPVPVCVPSTVSFALLYPSSSRGALPFWPPLLRFLPLVLSPGICTCASANLASEAFWLLWPLMLWVEALQPPTHMLKSSPLRMWLFGVRVFTGVIILNQAFRVGPNPT